MKKNMKQAKNIGLKKKPKLTTPKHKHLNTIRMNRPLGLTSLCIEYNKTNDPNTLYQIQKICVQEYALRNFSFAGKQRTIEDIAKFIHWPVKKVIQHISSPMKNWLEGYKVEDQYRVLISFLTQMGMSDRAQIQAQVEALKGSQGNQYVPFMTEQVNKALGLLNEQTRTMTQIFKEFKPSSPAIKFTQQNAIINGHNGPQTEQGRYLSTNEAMKLLEANRTESLLENESLQEAVLAESLDNNLPEVIATKQQGINPDGQTKPMPKKTRKDHLDRLAKGAQFISSPIIIP